VESIRLNFWPRDVFGDHFGSSQNFEIRILDRVRQQDIIGRSNLQLAHESTTCGRADSRVNFRNRIVL